MQHTPQELAPIGHLRGRPPAAPPWFDAALAHAPERSEVPVDGAAIELLTWGRRGDPGLLLLHGNSAHADWYSFIAPLVAEAGYRVAAMSFSGMGRSDWRSAYSIEQWSAEAQLAAAAAGLFDAPVAPWCAAHSFGGFVLMAAAARWGQRLGGAMIIDSPMRSVAQMAEREQRRRTQDYRPSRVYATLDEAVARFRFLPPQASAHPYAVDHIARHSLKPVAGGFTWRFDPFLFRHFSFGTPHQDIAQARCPLVLVRGGRSRLVSPGMLARALALAPPGTRCAELADADHHVMVDQPQALAELLKQALAAQPL